MTLYFGSGSHLLVADEFYLIRKGKMTSCAPNHTLLNMQFKKVMTFLDIETNNNRSISKCKATEHEFVMVRVYTMHQNCLVL